jgi:hypothetical protein
VSPERIAVELDAPAGEAVVVEWAPEPLERVESASDDDSLWRLGGELDWNQIDALRVISGRLGDGRLLALAALRPAGAAHGDEAISGWLGQPGELQRLTKVLLSTEYGADARPRRIGLELYPTADAVPVRVAGTAGAGGPSAEQGPRIRRRFDLRHAGEQGTAVYDLLTER